MSRNNKQCPEIEISGQKIISNNMKRTEVVLPGHYCSRETLKSEVKEIIRVIGPDRRRTGYWITQDGKSLHESMILDSYVALDTKANTDKSKKDSIMRGLKPVTLQEETESDSDENEEQVEEEHAPYSVIPDHLIPPEQKKTNQIKTELPKVNHKPVVVEDKFDETRKLIEKASIENLNKNYREKYGTQPYKPINIRIPFDIQIGYELNKLAQICELFDINIREVAELIYQNITLPKQEIINVIENQLRQTTIIPLFKSIESDKVAEVQMEQPKTFEEQLNEEKNNEKDDILGTGISEVDNYLSKMFNKK